jgi:hypothetical protein
MGKATAKLQGKLILERDVPFLTPEMIREHVQKLVGSDRRIVVRRGAEARPLDQFPSDFNLGNDVNLKHYPASTAKGAMSRRERFIRAQVASIAEVYGERYGQTIQLHKNLDFVVIPRFSLPRQWGMKTTPILIWFPQDYPDVSPNGFYLSKSCEGPHIFSRNVYGNSPDLSVYGWNWYCTHTHWRPDANPNDGDNLWTFLDIVRMSLTIKEF